MQGVGGGRGLVNRVLAPQVSTRTPESNPSFSLSVAGGGAQGVGGDRGAAQPQGGGSGESQEGGGAGGAGGQE